MTWALSQRCASSRDKFILVMLANYASNEDGRCFPSISTLAEQTEMSRDSVMRAIKSLEVDEFLWVSRRSTDGVNLPNYYTLNLDNLRGVVAPCDQGSSTLRPGVVAQSDHNLSIKPIIEPSSKSKEAKATRIPLDFTPEKEFASSLGLNTSQANSELDKFKDYWAAKPGKDGCKLDWQATWRNWIRNAVDRLPSSKAPTQQVDWQRRMDYYREKNTWSPAWGPAPGEIGCKAPQQYLNGSLPMGISTHQRSITTSDSSGYQSQT